MILSVNYFNILSKFIEMIDSFDIIFYRNSK